MPTLTNSEPLLQRIRGEFVESPGLRLTPWHFQRLWSLDADQAHSVIQQLVRAGFLREARDGTFLRRER